MHSQDIDPQQQVRIDISQAEDVPCSCGNLYFSPVMGLKRLSPILSPTGEELKFPVNALQCTNCNEVLFPFSEE